MTTKKSPAGPVCANCGNNGVTLKNCSRCHLVNYCNKECQVQHWTKGNHKQFCVPVGQRKPHVVAPRSNHAVKVTDSEECAICLSPLWTSNACLLPCSHWYHSECVTLLRKFGISEVCPLCRAALPAGPDSLFNEATRRYVACQKKVANEGDATAQFNVGLIYYKGQGEMQSYSEAAKWYRKAADQGYANAQFNVGLIYYEGHGVKQSYSEAAKWFRKAADQGYANAQFNLGFMYAKGQGVKQSDAEAAKWYRKAAYQGDADAQFSLGLIYYKGQGVKQSDAEAAKWYRKAADQGFGEAQFNLGFMYLEGRGEMQSYSEAAKWFRKAADQGIARAQYNLGVTYAYGKGVQQSDSAAAQWFQKAAKQGHAQAQCILKGDNSRFPYWLLLIMCKEI